MMVSRYKNLQVCRENIALVQRYLTSFVVAKFEGLNEIIMKWVFYRMQRSVSSSAPYNLFLKQLRVEKVMEKTLTTCFLT